MSDVLMQARRWCDAGPWMVRCRSQDVQILETETLSLTCTLQQVISNTHIKTGTSEHAEMKLRPATRNMVLPGNSPKPLGHFRCFTFRVVFIFRLSSFLGLSSYWKKEKSLSAKKFELLKKLNFFPLKLFSSNFF